MQALLDEDSTQTLKQLAKALEVDQVNISRRLHAIGKIQKEGKWAPYELKETLKGETILVKFCLIVSKEKSFLHRIVTGDEKWIYFDTLKRKKPWLDLG